MSPYETGMRNPAGITASSEFQGFSPEPMVPVPFESSNMYKRKHIIEENKSKRGDGLESDFNKFDYFKRNSPLRVSGAEHEFENKRERILPFEEREENDSIPQISRREKPHSLNPILQKGKRIHVQDQQQSQTDQLFKKFESNTIHY